MATKAQALLSTTKKNECHVVLDDGLLCFRERMCVWTIIKGNDYHANDNGVVEKKSKHHQRRLFVVPFQVGILFDNQTFNHLIG